MPEDNTQQLNDPADTRALIERVFRELLHLRETMLERFDRFEERLSTLEAKADERARETRPIWEKALAEIMAVGENVREMKGQLSVLGEDVLAVRSKQKEADLRLKELESYLHRA